MVFGAPHCTLKPSGLRRSLPNPTRQALKPKPFSTPRAVVRPPGPSTFSPTPIRLPAQFIRLPMIPSSCHLSDSAIICNVCSAVRLSVCLSVDRLSVAGLFHPSDTQISDSARNLGPSCILFIVLVVGVPRIGQRPSLHSFVHPISRCSPPADGPAGRGGGRRDCQGQRYAVHGPA
jgi:hypothetical protein